MNRVMLRGLFMRCPGTGCGEGVAMPPGEVHFDCPTCGCVVVGHLRACANGHALLPEMLTDGIRASAPPRQSPQPTPGPLAWRTPIIVVIVCHLRKSDGSISAIAYLITSTAASVYFIFCLFAVSEFREDTSISQCCC